jgi:hypothetical protein
MNTNLQVQSTTARPFRQRRAGNKPVTFRKIPTEEVEFLQGSKSQMDLSLIYPIDPKQLPKELAGVEWPPKE